MFQNELQDLYNELFVFRNEMACKFDADTRLIVVNDAYAQALNSTAEELIGRKFIDLIPEDEHEEVISHLKALTLKSPERTYEHKVILKDGTEKWQQWYDRAIFDEQGDLKYFISLGRDITDKKLLELEIEHRNRFQAILADLAIRLVNLPVAEFDAAMDDVLSIIGIYTQMEFAFVNFRNSSGEIKKRFYWTEHKNVDDQLKQCSSVFAAFEELIKERKLETRFIEDLGKLPETNKMRSKLGSMGVKSVITTPLLQNGQPVGVVAFFTISEKRYISEIEARLLKVLAELITNVEVRRSYENRLIAARNEAESANEAKSQFLANMSHEIRTPLNGMLGMAGLLSGTKLDERQRKYVNVLTTSGESLQYIINDLLDMNKLGGEKLLLDRSVLRLGDVITEVTELMKVDAMEKKLACDIEIHEGTTGFIFRGAKLRFKQILINLVSNAIKFTSKGGVRIECTASQSDETPGKIKVLCRITDTGIGIEKKDFGKLFKPFSQIDPSTSRKYGGTGLGLHISKTLVENMGGKIGVESTPGIRTTFWFYVFFEQVTEAEAAKIPGFTEKERPLGIDALLVAFPAGSVRSLLREFEVLQLRTNAVRDINEAKKFLDEVGRGGPEYIFMDFSTVGRDALVLTDELKNDFRHMNRKVILIANPNDDTSNNWLDEHDIHYILKRPVTTESLSQVIFDDLPVGKTGRTGTAGTSTHSDKTLKKSSGADRDSKPEKGGKPKVLIAEDNKVNQELISVIMQELNAAFHIVENGFEAVEAVQENDYDIVLMDCQMPEMDGFDATRNIRALKDPVKKKIPIIAVTAHVMSGYQQKCEAAGMNGYISKPYSVKDLQAAIYGRKPTSAVLHGEEFRALKVINYDLYKQRFGNDTELCSRILRRFVEETEKQIPQIDPQWDERSYHKLFDLVHSIKGASANIDAERLFSAAQKLSASIERRQDAIIPKRIERLKNEFTRLRNKLEDTNFSVTEKGDQN
ncbi:MAG: response regulator [Candidatus Cyclonatronum sp.]|uniref:response regulator n=1 Tax=Cyclonatronum sp. TaxID=3024185 RepID=UPI0025C52309|nr:response regulator [Cyclonatronum sp.]MCH8486194.1 response regulator [Cyclonatronum sp.]